MTDDTDTQVCLFSYHATCNELIVIEWVDLFDCKQFGRRVINRRWHCHYENFKMDWNNSIWFQSISFILFFSMKTYSIFLNTWLLLWNWHFPSYCIFLLWPISTVTLLIWNYVCEYISVRDTSLYQCMYMYMFVCVYEDKRDCIDRKKSHTIAIIS